MAEAASFFPASELKVFPARALQDQQVLEQALSLIKRSDAVLVFQTEDPVWGPVTDGLPDGVPVAWLTMDGAAGACRGVSGKILQSIGELLTHGGAANARTLWSVMLALAAKTDFEVQVERSPNLGIWHPQAPDRYYANVSDYLKFYEPYAHQRSLGPATVGILMHRHFWNVDRPLVEEALICALEARGLKVRCLFVDQGLGEGADVLKYLSENLIGVDGTAAVEVLIKLVAVLSLGAKKTGSSYIGDDSPAGPAASFFRQLGVQVLQPAVSHRLSLAQWELDPSGLGPEVSWSMTLPEFEGVIEPMLIGGTESDFSKIELESARRPHLERVGHLADRVKRWVELRRTPVENRKIALILHNAPCASVEATIGTASGLEAFETVTDIARFLKSRGWSIEPPESGRSLLDTIMSRKAISEFRWTTVQEIVGKGGALARVPLADYQAWYDEFPKSVQTRLDETWGEPPGREVDGVPAAMVFEGDLVVSGLTLGPKAVVLVQPKRGCAGSRCDGRVCKILHDPTIPPPHQYLATYRWLTDERGFGAHVIIHVGTHGNLEYLPGKSLGLSQECLPDLALGTVPHLYIYNSGVTADGLMAKRRAYAVLVDHLQPVMSQAGLHGELSDLSDLIGQWERSEGGERKSRLELLIREQLSSSPLARDLPMESDSFESIVRALKGALMTVSQSLIEQSLHVFGRIPEGEQLEKIVACALRYESGDNPSLRFLIAAALGLDLTELLKNSNQKYKTNGRLISAAEVAAALDTEAGRLSAEVLNGRPLVEALGRSMAEGPLAALVGLTFPAAPIGLSAVSSKAGSGVSGTDFGPRPDQSLSQSESTGPILTELARTEKRISDLQARLRACRELESLSEALGGKFVTPGPSGLLSRGFDSAAPTGRNFYSRDPRRAPTRAAAEVGRLLAKASLDRFWAEEGRYPNNMAFFWISSDLLQADGEVLAQMLALMGLNPTWDPAGLASGFEVIPLEALGRPRIDVTCRMSGIIRDCFRSSYEYLDRAISLVAALNEPPEANYVRARALEAMPQELEKSDSNRDLAWRRATTRIFSQAPGSFESGTYLAIMASAWETEAELAEIFVHHHSHAYGSDGFGLAAPELFERQLQSVDLNMLNLHDDHQDFLGCGGFFGAQGGMAQAAGYFKGVKIKSYLGDTRETSVPVIRTLSAEINRCFQARLLNPVWIKNMIAQGYKGAAEISRRVTNAFGWAATTGEVDGAAFDGLVKGLLADDEVRNFFETQNPWALEEIGRRLLEAQSRGLWNPEPEVLEILKEKYLSLEGVLEEGTEAFGGDLQGGSVDIITSSQLPNWRKKLDDYRHRAGLGAVVGPS
jgi:cobaltochelatase CobN